MTSAILIIFCSLLLIAYVFDLTAEKTKIPSVILLLILGFGLQQATSFFEIEVPDFSKILPIIAYIGLILIVLEGSLELNVNKSKVGLIRKSFLGALGSMVILAFILAFVFQKFGGYSFTDSLLNAIPLCIISSAIAIPSAATLSHTDKEFVIYESSLSDILGVLFFNFMAANEIITLKSFGVFGGELIILFVSSIIATLFLSFLLRKIDHHVKFAPIILMVILVYSILKVYHLSALIFILIFGLFVGNLNNLKSFKMIKRFNTDELQEEIEKFKDLSVEGAFLVRSLFFILFGFLIKTSELLNAQTFVWAVIIVVLMFIVRIVQLLVSKLPVLPLLFVAPRGLITILLFIAITAEQSIDVVNKSLIIQIIILTALVMTFGLMFTTKNETKEEIENQELEKIENEI